MRTPLTCRAVAIPELTTEDRDTMLSLMLLCYDGVERERFHADLDTKNHVLFSGDTVIHPDWWGTRALHAGFIAYGLRRWIRRPWRPIYWLLLSKGYKTYLLLVNNFSRSSPRPDRDDDDAMSELRNRVA